MMLKRERILLIIVLICGMLICSCGMNDEVSDEILSGESGELGTEERMGETALENDYDLPMDANEREEAAEHNQEKIYSIEDYGLIEEKQQDFLGGEESNVVYFYKMVNFFLRDSFPNADLINQTLRQIYDEMEEGYIETSEVYSGEDDGFDTPYLSWNLVGIEYVGDDYISILYNEIYYMGGAHPYSCLEGITIDCKTGELISASLFLEKDDEEILTEISDLMGLDDIGTWDDIDFYLTDSAIVFFYRMPGFWEDVVLRRT